RSRYRIATKRRVHLDSTLRWAIVVSDIRDDSNNLLGAGGVIPNVIADRVSVGPKLIRQLFVNQRDRPTLRTLICRERATLFQRDAHRFEIIVSNNTPIYIYQFARIDFLIATVYLGIDVVLPPRFEARQIIIRHRGRFNSRQSVNSFEDLRMKLSECQAPR